MAIETFGVTPATLSSIAQGMAIDALSVPNIVTVETMIDLAGAQVEGEANAVGITDFSDDTTLTYAILRKMVIALALADIYAARNSGTEQATYWKASFDSLQETLRKRPQSVSTDRSAPQIAVNISPRTNRTNSYNRFF